MKRRTKGLLLRCIAILLDVGAPLTATAIYFPLWVERSAEATVSGMFVVLGLLSAIPLFRIVKERIKSPSSWMVWLILLIVFAALETIVSEIKIISLVGLISNLIGAILYRHGGRLGEGGEEDE